MTQMDAKEILAGLKKHVVPGSTLFVPAADCLRTSAPASLPRPPTAWPRRRRPAHGPPTSVLAADGLPTSASAADGPPTSAPAGGGLAPVGDGEEEPYSVPHLKERQRVLAPAHRRDPRTRSPGRPRPGRVGAGPPTARRWPAHVGAGRRRPADICFGRRRPAHVGAGRRRPRAGRRRTVCRRLRQPPTAHPRWRRSATRRRSSPTRAHTSTTDNAFSHLFSSTSSNEDISGGDPNDPKDQLREAEALQPNSDERRVGRQVGQECVPRGGGGAGEGG